MSDLWNRCRAILRTQMSIADWEQCAEPLRAWMDDDVLYIWIKRGHQVGVRRVSASALDGLIRETVHRVWGRKSVRIVRVPQAPNRERIINERREREHRAQLQRRAPKELDAFLTYAMDECRRLAEDPSSLPRFTGSPEEQQRQLMAIVEAKARRRLEQEGWPSGTESPRTCRGAPPRDPPAWRPVGELREANASISLFAEDNQEPSPAKLARSVPRDRQ